MYVVALCSSIAPLSGYASGMFGNPTVIGTPGSFDVQIGGGQMSKLDLDGKKTTGSVQIGAVSGTAEIPAWTGRLEEDQMFFGVSYAMNPNSQLFVNLGSGKDSGQQSTSRAIGVRLSPDAKGSNIKAGLVLRAQQVTVDIDGPFYQFISVSDGINNSSASQLLNGSEQLKFSRLDAFFGLSTSTGTVRPYGGLCLSRISGTDTTSMNDTALITSYPVGGGLSTTSDQQVSFNSKADLSENKNFSGVLGASINPDGNYGLTIEFQTGVQQSIMMSGNVRF